MEESSEKHIVFVGLGNPGKKYAMTRHNMGAIIVEGFAYLTGVPLKEEKRFLARVGKTNLDGTVAHCVLPMTYMNESGQAVRKYMDYFKLTPQNIVVVSDDADLPFGEMRLRSQGSSGGHNGLKSIQQHMDTDHYTRLRVGIGRRGEFGAELSNYVLDKFTRKEEEDLQDIVSAGVSTLKLLLVNSVDQVMNRINIKRKDKQEEKS